MISFLPSLLNLRIQLPNVPYEIVPKGNSEKDNEEIFKSEMPKPNIDYLPHWELGKKYDIIDFELGSKVTGSGFPVYKGKGAKLQRGLINYFLDKNTSAGYTEFQVPHLVNPDSAFATGQLPDKDGQMYHVNEDNFYLIPEYVKGVKKSIKSSAGFDAISQSIESLMSLKSSAVKLFGVDIIRVS